MLDFLKRKETFGRKKKLLLIGKRDKNFNLE